jgi:endo-1,3(4)-beta-glucanase
VGCTIESPQIKYNIHLAQGMPFIHVNISFFTNNVFNMTTWPPIESFTSQQGIPNIYQITLTNGNQWLIFTPPNAMVWQTTYNQISFTKGTFLRLLYVEQSFYSFAVQSYPYLYSHLLVQTSVEAQINGSTKYTYGPLNWTNGNFSFFALSHHVEKMRMERNSPSCTIFPTSLISSHGQISFAVCKKPFVFSLQFSSAAYNHPYSFPDIPPSYLNTVRASFVNDICTTLYMSISSDCSTGLYWISKSIHRLSLSIQLANQIGEIAIRNTLVVKLYNLLLSLLTQNFVYDSTWRGILCTNDMLSVDNNYGCGWYNDHHFQYGYIILAGAIVSKYNETCKLSIQPYIDGLVQDVYKRHFNWFLGHSWATGLFSGERNQESSSEAIQADWAIYLWGEVTQQTDIQNHGQAMVLLESYATHVYYPSLNSLYSPPYGDRTITGVLFDTWTWYSTFFGSNSEYIHGIHFLPYGTHHLLKFWPMLYTQEWFELQSTQTGNWKPIVYGIWSQINQTSAWEECINAQDSDFDVFSPRSIVLWFIATMGTSALP